MVKKINEKKYREEGIIEFETNLHGFRPEKSLATISCPFPVIKEKNINKETNLLVSVKVLKQ